ncbi:MAG: bifunctional riboflavin kinase/FAD synthetase [Chloroflexota bacterium]
MQTFPSIENINLQNSWLTIGIFDGVHRGHQEILRQLVSGAHEEGSPAVILTFSPHPAVVFGKKSDFKCLTTLDERIELLEAFDVDAVIIQTFDRTLANQTAEEFMGRVSRTLGLCSLFVGYDAALGRGREGDAARLTEIGKKLGYTVQVIPPLKDKAGVLSSTRIRAAVAAGDVSAAASDLGRYFFVTGPIVHGNGRGRTINIPTANIQIPMGKLIPANGIYATWARVGGKKYPAATSIGIRPTFTPEESVSHVEAHLLDFHQDIYGQEIKLEFVEYLRPEEKFPSVEDLLEQIHADIGRTRNILS